MSSDAPATDLAAVSAAVLDAESEFDLIDRRVDRAAYWERVRFDVHRRLLVESGTMQPPDTGTATYVGRLALHAKALWASIGPSALRTLPPSDILLVGGGRRVYDREAGGWRSPYWEPLVSELGDDAVVVEYQGAAPWSPAASGTRTFYLDRLYAAARLRGEFNRLPPLPRAEAAVLADVGRRLARSTGVELDLSALVRADLARRSAVLPRMERILESARPAAVVVECSYGKHTVMEAAQRTGIPVVEIQHGVVSRHHFGYHFPERSGTPAVFPDRFLAWGTYWTDAADFPIRPDRIVAAGFPRFDTERERVRRIEKSDTILFLSQTMLGRDLSRFAAELAKHGLRDRIVYRLHPREVTGWRDRYPWLVQAGVRVSGPDVSLYEQLQTASTHVGTFSTAIFEGLALGANTYLVEAPGIEYMTQLLNTGQATLVRTPRALAAAITEDDRRGPARPADSFFRPGALDRICAHVRGVADRQARSRTKAEEEVEQDRDVGPSVA